MKSVYRVEYEYQMAGRRSWAKDSANVLTNGDAQSAVNRMREIAMKASFEDDNGKTVKTTRFRLVGVHFVAEVDH